MQDLYYVSSWWVMFLILGLINLPLSLKLFKKNLILANGFSKISGVILLSFSSYLFAILKLIPFTRISLFALFLALAFANYIILKKNGKSLKKSFKKVKKYIFVQEMLFTFGLFLWSIIRGYSPEIRGLEKFMDLGFINSILNTKYLPPSDMWASGLSINYYWFGHFVIAFLTKLSNISSAVTYNLSLATIMGLTLTEIFTLVFSLLTSSQKKVSKGLVLFALISAILTTFGGNFHTPLYIVKEGVDNYWYPDATRFIGYNPDVDDKTIHEFPLYSFVVSDLHAHLINLPVVLLFLSLLWSVYKNRFKFIALIPLGILLGIMFTANAWDLAIYLLVFGVASLFFGFNKKAEKYYGVVKTAKSIALVVLLAGITALPFLANFESIAQGVGFVNSSSALWQLGVLWGFPAILTVMLTYFSKREFLSSANLFVISLFVSSWALVIIPEIIYVKDIYIASHHRANTMFKLTYQAFVMFYLSSGYIFYKFINSIKKERLRAFFTTAITMIIFSLMVYPFISISSYYQKLSDYKGLDGRKWINSYYPEYNDVISWITENVSKNSVVLEAQGDSYTDYNLVSAYTGIPTVQGWFVHEWLWRGTSDFSQQRGRDVETIYSSTKVDVVKNLLTKYKINYVVFGEFEKEKYETEKNILDTLGKIVFQSGDSAIYLVD